MRHALRAAQIEPFHVMDVLARAQALEALPDAIMLTSANLEGAGPEVLFVNQAFEHLSGLDATTLVARARDMSARYADIRQRQRV